MGKYRAMYNQLKRQAREDTIKQAALPNALLRLLGQTPKKPSIWKKLLPLLGLGAAGGAVAAVPEAREFAGNTLSSGKDAISNLLAQLRGGGEGERAPMSTRTLGIRDRLDTARRQAEGTGLSIALGRAAASRNPEAIGRAQSDLASFIGNTPAESTAVRPSNAELRTNYSEMSQKLKELVGTPAGDELRNLMHLLRIQNPTVMSGKPGPGLTEGPKGDIMNFLRSILGA